MLQTIALGFVGIVARCAVAVGLVLILSRTWMPRKKGYRFVCWFVLLVLFYFAINYMDVRFLGFHKLTWTWAIILALIVATIGTFWPS